MIKLSELKRSTKIFLFVSLIFAAIDLVYVLISLKFASDSFHSNLRQQSSTLHFNFHNTLDQTYSSMLSMATFIANDSGVQQTFLKGKLAVEAEGGGAGKELADIARKELHKQVAGNWEAVQNAFAARQLHFHLGPGSTSFLRVHRPQKFGDNMDNVRFTIVDANQNLTSVKGFETGRVYSGLRGVVPVFATDPVSGDKVHVGALEVGTSFDTMLNIIDNNSLFKVGIVLTREHIESAMWPDAIERRFGEFDGCDYVTESASDDSFKAIVTEGCKNKLVFEQIQVELIGYDGSTYMVSTFPLRDYRGTNDIKRADAGAVVFWRNIDIPVQAFNETRFYIALYGVIGFIIIELLFFFAFLYVTNHLQGQIEKKTEELTVTKERLNKAQEVAQVGNWEWDIDSGELWWSAQIYRIFAIDERLVSPTYEKFLGFIHPEDVQKVEDSVQHALDTHEAGEVYDIQHRVITPDGNEKYVQERGLIEFDEDGNPVKMCGTVQDITEEKKLESRLTEILKATNAGTWEWDLNQGKLSVNENWLKYLGLDGQEINVFDTGKWRRVIHPRDYKLVKANLTQVVKGIRVKLDMDMRVKRHVNKEWVWVHIDGRVIERSSSGEALVMAGTAIDITRRKNNEMAVKHLAETDVLTDLYNRSYFNNKLAEQISIFQRTGQKFALMMLDLDGFKQVNDQYGHHIGDELLKHVAKVLKSVARKSDVIARFGGDEFIYILPTIDEERGCIGYAERVLEELNRPVNIEGKLVGIGASIGYLLYYDEALTAEQAIIDVDNAMYRAKQNGKNTYTVA